MSKPRIFSHPITEVFGRGKEKKEKTYNNDLLTEPNDIFKEAILTHKIIKKYGFSRKSVNLTKKFNTKMREDLKLDDLEYFVMVCTFVAHKVSCSIVAEMINEISFNANITILQILFNLYRKNILGIVPESGEISFGFSVNLLGYFQNGQISEEVFTIKRIIREIDTIANYYNNPVAKLREIGEQNILALLEKNSDKELFKLLLDCVQVEGPPQYMFDYKFLFYMLGHLIINSSSVSSIEKNDELVVTFASRDSVQAQVVTNIFNPNNKHPFFQKKILDYSTDESGKVDKDTIEIHADFKRKYLKDIIKEKTNESVIKAVNIPKKNLFFNKKTEEKIDELSDLLSPRKFSQIKRRIANSGTRTGFICLLSGSPGTGKTSFALEIARQTKRDLIKVDMSSIRSKWWGEDEKNVKNIFNNYKSVLDESKLEPILLLNEADALIGKRLDVSGHNGAIISSINATQNIILDAFDEFEGILMATTNLTKNFDPAFERRFLYKLELDKPDYETRSKILIDKLSISEEIAIKLSKEFELTGSNVENIYRKYITKKILYGNECTYELLHELAKDEFIKKDSNPIGFIGK